MEYASADLLVFPSETETFGNAVLEAMASGLPVVTSDRMAPRELIEYGVTGFAATVGVDFRYRVEELIRDSEKRRRMGAAARRFACTRSWQEVFDGLLEDYHAVIREAGWPHQVPSAPRPARALVRNPASTGVVFKSPA
jgi:glycosyltransferase involved in cell wall biosynthesis